MAGSAPRRSTHALPEAGRLLRACRRVSRDRHHEIMSGRDARGSDRVRFPNPSTRESVDVLRQSTRNTDVGTTAHIGLALAGPASPRAERREVSTATCLRSGAIE